MSLADQQARARHVWGSTTHRTASITQTTNDLYTQQMQATAGTASNAAIQYELGNGPRRCGPAGQTPPPTTIGAGAAAGGAEGPSLAALSDETKKTDIKPGGKDLGSFLDALTPSKYKYKDEADGEGEFWSPMAQDLEKTPVGRSMVIDTPRGKAVDYARGFGAYLAATADLHQRVKKLEGKGASNG
jgi:hypothetical protein